MSRTQAFGVHPELSLMIAIVSVMSLIFLLGFQSINMEVDWLFLLLILLLIGFAFFGAYWVGRNDAVKTHADMDEEEKAVTEEEFGQAGVADIYACLRNLPLESPQQRLERLRGLKKEVGRQVTEDDFAFREAIIDTEFVMSCPASNASGKKWKDWKQEVDKTFLRKDRLRMIYQKRCLLVRRLEVEIEDLDGVIGREGKFLGF